MARLVRARATSWPWLDLLIAGNARARGISELAETVNRHGSWLAGKRFLMVPFHMIGARNVESAILGGYADYVRRMHPEAPYTRLLSRRATV